MRLSKAQVATLKRMAPGNQIWSVSGINPSAFWHGDASSRVRFDTIHALHRRELIENFESDYTGSKYRISKHGLAALKAYQQENG